MRGEKRFYLVKTTAILMLALTQVALALGGAVPASAAISPVVPPSVQQVTGDALPTVQIDGVVWSLAVVGNTVYAGGQFTTARPAGSPPGAGAVTRTNLLAFDITTGKLLNSFSPSVNGQIKTVVASPDGLRVYIAGAFTSVNGLARYRIAAFDTATGSLIDSFKPYVNYNVSAIAATNTTVYIGGAFNNVAGSARARLAALRASDGSLLAWAPSADDTVQALVVAPGGAKVIAGGSFKNIGATPAYGMAALDASTGRMATWNATNIIRNAGTGSAILKLRTDGVNVYGNGYVYGGGGNLEGAFAAEPVNGDLVWIEDCHGDTYDNFPINGVVYTVSHAHDCTNTGGFREKNPKSFHHALAFTANATGTLGKNFVSSYFNFEGKPSPSLTTWFPDVSIGTFTGKSQAAWSVSGNSNYIVLGGEFPSVNGTAQQGLVRFAVKSMAPNKMGPKLSGAAFQPTLQATTSGIKVTWQSNWDIDDYGLIYRVVRNGQVVKTLTGNSTFWNLPTFSYTDPVTTAGTYSYRIEALDSSNNVAVGSTVSVTRAGAAAALRVAESADTVPPQQATAAPQGPETAPEVPPSAEDSRSAGPSIGTPVPTATPSVSSGTTGSTMLPADPVPASAPLYEAVGDKNPLAGTVH